MGRIRRGLRLAALSWQVLLEQPSVLVLPVVAALTQAVVAAAYVFGVVGTHHVSGSQTQEIVRFFPLYLAMTLIGTFANAALVTVADARMRGTELSLGEGLRRATAYLPQILGWSLLSATVGTLLRLLEDRLPLAGRIAAAIAGVAWSVATVLAVPVLVLEGRGPFDTVGRSARLFRDRWGETLVSDGACSLAVMLVSLPALVVAALGFFVSPVLGVALVALVLGAMIAISGALNGIVLTAAYRFAAFGQVGAGFTEADLSLPFRARRRRRG